MTQFSRDQKHLCRRIRLRVDCLQLLLFEDELQLSRLGQPIVNIFGFRCFLIFLDNELAEVKPDLLLISHLLILPFHTISTFLPLISFFRAALAIGTVQVLSKSYI